MNRIFSDKIGLGGDKSATPKFLDLAKLSYVQKFCLGKKSILHKSLLENNVTKIRKVVIYFYLLFKAEIFNLWNTKSKMGTYVTVMI
jgi:hypothetical protein